MLSQIRDLLKSQPFVPFWIVMTSGQKYRVPTPEHAGFDPQSTRLVVWLDNGSGIMLAGLHIAALDLDVLEPAGKS
jgi:hypothetical protein